MTGVQTCALPIYAIEAAIVKVLDDGYRTGDIMTPGGKRLSCSDMGDAISEAI